jgi:hypothetical protein
MLCGCVCPMHAPRRRWPPRVWRGRWGVGVGAPDVRLPSLHAPHGALQRRHLCRPRVLQHVQRASKGSGPRGVGDARTRTPKSWTVRAHVLLTLPKQATPTWFCCPLSPASAPVPCPLPLAMSRPLRAESPRPPLSAALPSQLFNEMRPALVQGRGGATGAGAAVGVGGTAGAVSALSTVVLCFLTALLCVSEAISSATPTPTPFSLHYPPPLLPTPPYPHPLLPSTTPTPTPLGTPCPTRAFFQTRCDVCTTPPPTPG